MALDQLLGYFACTELKFQDSGVPLRGLEIWATSGQADPILRDTTLRTEELLPWLEQQEDPFRVPPVARRVSVTGKLRLLCQQWPYPYHQDKVMTMSSTSWEYIEDFLGLPRSYIFDFESTKHVPNRVSLHQGRNGKCLGIICQSPPLLEEFMTLVLSYDLATKTTNGFIAFVGSADSQSPGFILVESLATIPRLGQLISNPMLLPALAYGMWVDSLHFELGMVAGRLREVQNQTGLLGNYLRAQKMRMQDDVGYQNAHQNLIEQHAYLTNGVSDFVSSPGASAIETQDKVTAFCNLPVAPGGQSRFDDADVRNYLEHMKIRTDVEMQHRQRMLDRMNMYLQVVGGLVSYSLLPYLYILTSYTVQPNATGNRTRNKERLVRYEKHHCLDDAVPTGHGNRGEWSTTVPTAGMVLGSFPNSSSFLSLTLFPDSNQYFPLHEHSKIIPIPNDHHIADFIQPAGNQTIMSPFLIISTDNRLSMVPQFWIFWAITIPVTLVVLLVWILWIERDRIFEILGWERLPPERKSRRRNWQDSEM